MHEIFFLPEENRAPGEQGPNRLNRENEYTSANLTLGVLRFVAGASVFIGILVSLFALMAFANARTGEGSFLLAVCVGALVQGFIIFALFNALALIVENLVGIRKSLTMTEEGREGKTTIHNLEK